MINVCREDLDNFAAWNGERDFCLNNREIYEPYARVKTEEVVLSGFAAVPGDKCKHDTQRTGKESKLVFLHGVIYRRGNSRPSVKLKHLFENVLHNVSPL